MNTLLRLTKVELLKIRKHWLTWVLLIALMLILAIYMNGLRRDAHAHPLTETAVVNTDTLTENLESGFDMSSFSPIVSNEDYWEAATLPGVFVRFWRMVDWLNYAVIALGIIFVGQEFRWGTLRMILMRGVNRSQMVWSKFLALAVVTTVYLFVLWLETAVFGLFLTNSLSGSVDWSFLNSAFLLEQLGGIGRMWLLVLPFIAFTLAVNIIVGRPGPAFSLLFMLYFLSWFSYMSLMVIVMFFMRNPDFDPVTLGNSFFGTMMQWSPHYNSRLFLYLGEPDILSEMDYGLRQMAGWLQFTISLWLSLGRLWLCGFGSLLAALYSFNRREITS